MGVRPLHLASRHQARLPSPCALQSRQRCLSPLRVPYCCEQQRRRRPCCGRWPHSEEVERAPPCPPRGPMPSRSSMPRPKPSQPKHPLIPAREQYRAPMVGMSICSRGRRRTGS
jgi:hypothetical protein